MVAHRDGRDNPGAKRLRDLGFTQTQIAHDIGADQGLISRWWRGEQKPISKYRAKLEAEYGIGWRLWDDDADDETSELGAA